MIFRSKLAGLVAAAALGLVALSAPASAEVVLVNDDPNAEGLAFGSNDLFSFGGWGQDDTRSFAGNDFAALSALAPGAFSGAGNSNPVMPNDPAILAVNGGLPMQEGNVLRHSMWIASDPDDPFIDGGIQATFLKMEFWDTALSTDRGNDLTWDTEAFGGDFTSFAGQLSTTEWTQFVFEYEVLDSEVDLATLQEWRNVLIVGDFTGDPAPPVSGTMLFDRIIVEVFADQDAADGSPPDPTYPGGLPEPASLALLALGGLVALRKRG